MRPTIVTSTQERSHAHETLLVANRQPQTTVGVLTEQELLCYGTFADGKHIIGGSRAALFAHLVRLVKRGVMPVLLHGDALWVVSDDPHPLTAVPGLLNGPRWNGYRGGYTVPLTLSRDVQHIFQTVTSPDHAAGLLDALAHEERHPAEK